MAKVTFQGPEDVRELAAADLKKAGVEGFSKTEFRKGVEVEVDDAVASALLADSGLFGKFAAEKVEDTLDIVDSEPTISQQNQRESKAPKK